MEKTKKKNNMQWGKSRGFTLVELLVVIAIIGILSGLVIVNMSNAIKAAKDARMKGDLAQINKVFSMYNASNGYYPGTDGALCKLGDTTTVNADCIAINNILMPSYYSSIPRNPNDDSYYTYQSSSGSDYTLSSVMSNSYAYVYSPSSGYVAKTPVPGACGTASRAFPAAYSSYGSATFCSAGTSSPANPAFPSSGSPTTWTCQGVYGGADASCAASTVPSACVSGGGLTCTETLSGAYTVDIYAGPGSTTWVAPAGVTSVSYLVVGGGGGANYDSAYVLPGGTGGSSSFGSVTASGGGGGAYYLRDGIGGASGGGAGGSGGNMGPNPGGSGISGQGNAGGGSVLQHYTGGGGGGAGGAGSYTTGAYGGPGLSSDITGTTVYYAGGGGGGSYYSSGAGAGGIGGGGSGVYTRNQNGNPGTAGTGGGGGGAYYATGGAGGSGIVIIRYLQ
jgi:type II secretion system protein G